MIEYSERLQAAMKAAGMDTTTLSKALGMSYQGVKRVLDGKSKAFSAANNEEAARLLRVSSRWLATGIGEQSPGGDSETPWPLPAIPREKIEELAKDPAKLERLQGAVGMALAMLETGAGAVPTQRVPAPKAANDGTFEAIRKLPVKIAATISGVAPNDIHVEGSGTFLVPTAWVQSKGLNPESLIAVEVKGMSMYPRVHEGDTVVLNVADTQRQAGQVYAFNHEGEFTLKRAEKRANRWYLVSENPDQAKYPPVPCTESTALIGKVVLMQAENV